MEAQASAPQDIRNVVNFLRSSKAGIKIKVGALNGKRTDYFRGASPPRAPRTWQPRSQPAQASPR